MSLSLDRPLFGPWFCSLVVGWIAVLVPFAPAPATGSDHPTADQPQHAAGDLQGLIEDGLSFERQSLWGDAIQHYERALRDRPGNGQLEQRLLICRLHFDVDRRYQDASFLEAVAEVPADQALDLYLEVLANLETHYVDLPSWRDVIRYGTASFEVALTEGRFLEKHLAGVSTEKIEQLRLNIHREVMNRPTATRFDLRATAWHAATVANRQLGISRTAVIFEYVCGAVGTLDPYSRFLTPSQLDDTFSSIEGNFVGLGVELKAENQCLQIISVIPGGPAEEAGLCGGDAIVAVAGTSTQQRDPDVVADLLRGPEGSQVELEILRGDGTRKSLRVTRRRVEVPSVENVRMLDTETGTGYFRLTNFQVTTVKDVERALWQLHRQGMQRLIVDLRGNPGGVLTAAVEVADRFIEQGRIVSTRGRNGSENFEYRAHRPNTWKVPLYVLIDADSASASEIFAGAMHDAGRATLVGEKSYGKGSVQGIFRLTSVPVGICLTTSKWYTPNNTSVSRCGVPPDLPVTPTYIMSRPTDAGQIASQADDAILAAALRQARGEGRLSSLSTASK